MFTSAQRGLSHNWLEKQLVHIKCFVTTYISECPSSYHIKINAIPAMNETLRNTK